MKDTSYNPLRPSFHGTKDSNRAPDFLEVQTVVVGQKQDDLKQSLRQDAERRHLYIHCRATLLEVSDLKRDVRIES